MFGARTVAGLAVAVLALAGCGTVVYENEFTVTVSESSATAPVPVAIFDNRMGDTADWARQHMGTTSPDQTVRPSPPGTLSHRTRTLPRPQHAAPAIVSRSALMGMWPPRPMPTTASPSTPMTIPTHWIALGLSASTKAARTTVKTAWSWRIREARPGGIPASRLE